MSRGLGLQLVVDVPEQSIGPIFKSQVVDWMILEKGKFYSEDQ